MASSITPPSVLIVDDDPTIRFILRRELHKRDRDGRKWAVFTAAGPEDGLALVDAAPRDRPLVVIADFDLRAAMDGAEVLVEVRKRRPDARLLLFSGRPREELDEAIERARPMAFLEKPRRVESLLHDLVPLITGAPGPSPDAPAPAPAVTPARRASASRADEPGVYRAILESVVDYAVFMVDADGRIATWNRGGLALTGYGAEEIIGEHVSVLYAPNDITNHRPDYDLNVAAEEGRIEDEGWRVRKDGGMFWADVIVTAMRDGEGRLVGFSHVVRDLTEALHHEEALRRSEESYRLLVVSVKDYAIFHLDPSGRVASWNEGAERIKGYKADEILGSHLSRFYTEEDRERSLPQHALQRAIENGHYEAEGWRVRKDGTRFWVNAVITPLYGADGRLRGFAKVTRDLTQRKMDEEAIRLRAEQLSDLTRELEAFNYTVAHDLRAPLRAIIHLTEALSSPEEDLSEKERAEIVSSVHESAQRMSQLVEDLLALSRATRGTLRHELVDVTGLARAVAREVAGRADGARPDVRVDEGLVAEADPSMLRIVLENLLSNAFKFTRRSPRPSVRVGSVDTGGVQAFFVEDNGVGFDPAQGDRLFRPFQRLHGANEFEGTGIGLATVHRIVSRHGGRVWAESRPGQGATFYFTLPRTERRAEAARPGQTPA